MDDRWKSLSTLPERMRWSRMLAGYERPTDAAVSLGIRPGTYRTYEAASDNGGREPPLTEAQRIARKFGVNWIWLVTGDGRPKEAPIDKRVLEINDKIATLSDADRDTALDAASNVVEAFTKRGRR